MYNLSENKSYTALPEPHNSWVVSSKGNSGEVDHYRDVYNKQGRLIYCYGENCELERVDDKRNVKLFNKSSGEGFWITQEQFIEDFVPATSEVNAYMDELVTCSYCCKRMNVVLDEFTEEGGGFIMCPECEANL